MAMLTIRARRFLKNTGRKLTINGNFMPLKLDLSFSGLEEFTCEPIVIKPVVENNKAKVSNNEEDDVPQAKIEKKSIKPSFAKIAFVKPKEKTARKTAK
ncbi:hypothetical protein Tco_0744968 [Tanacetum coccineum]